MTYCRVTNLTLKLMCREFTELPNYICFKAPQCAICNKFISALFNFLRFALLRTSNKALARNLSVIIRFTSVGLRTRSVTRAHPNSLPCPRSVQHVPYGPNCAVLVQLNFLIDQFYLRYFRYFYMYSCSIKVFSSIDFYLVFSLYSNMRIWEA